MYGVCVCVWECMCVHSFLILAVFITTPYRVVFMLYQNKIKAYVYVSCIRNM